MERFERYAEIERNEQRAESYLVDDAEIVLAAYGASARVARSAVNAARERASRRVWFVRSRFGLIRRGVEGDVWHRQGNIWWSR